MTEAKSARDVMKTLINEVKNLKARNDEVDGRFEDVDDRQADMKNAIFLVLSYALEDASAVMNNESIDETVRAAARDRYTLSMVTQYTLDPEQFRRTYEPIFGEEMVSEFEKEMQ